MAQIIETFPKALVTYPGAITFPRTRVTYAWMVAAVTVIGLCFAVPTLWSGFAIDDYAQLSIIEQWYPEQENPFNLYSTLIKHIQGPWWTSPELEISFWRPLSSALLRLDYALFGREAVPYHVHSLLWLAALLAAIGLLYSRLPRRVAIPALVILALDESLAWTAGWVANRHTLVSMTPAVVALWAYLRWRQDGWRPGLPLALAGFAVGLLGGETAFAIMAYVLAFEVFAAPGGARERLVSILPVAALAVGYLLVYKALGHGSSEVALYLDPIKEPGSFLAGAATRVPALLAGALWAVPPPLWFLDSMRVVQIALTVLGLAGGALLLRAAWPRLSRPERGGVLALLAGTFGSLLPIASAVPFSRLLLPSMLGLAVLLAAVLNLGWAWWREAGKRQGSRRFWQQAGAVALLLVVGTVHLGAAPLSRLHEQKIVQQNDQLLTRVLEQLPLGDAETDDAETGNAETGNAEIGAEPQHYVLVNAPDFLVMSYVPLYSDYHRGPGKLTWSVLTVSPFEHVVTRTGPDTLVVEGEMFNTHLEQLFRPAGEPAQPGQLFTRELYTAELLPSDDPAVQRVVFRFRSSLDELGVKLLVWSHDRLQEVEVPAVGSSLQVAAHPFAEAARTDRG